MLFGGSSDFWQRTVINEMFHYYRISVLCFKDQTGFFALLVGTLVGATRAPFYSTCKSVGLLCTGDVLMCPISGNEAFSLSDKRRLALFTQSMAGGLMNGRTRINASQATTLKTSWGTSHTRTVPRGALHVKMTAGVMPAWGRASA